MPAPTMSPTPKTTRLASPMRRASEGSCASLVLAALQAPESLIEVLRRGRAAPSSRRYYSPAAGLDVNPRTSAAAKAPRSAGPTGSAAVRTWQSRVGARILGGRLPRRSRRRHREEPTTASWPELDFPAWRDTCSALHLYLQVVGKYRLARTPWINHSWHATFYVTPRGLPTSMIADGPGGIEIELDFLDHAVVGSASSGRTERFDLGPTSVREFHGRFLELVKSLGGTSRIHGRPSEIPNPVPFAEDREPRPYDADAVSRFHRALVLVVPVLTRFRSGFVGKASPVHLFWGALDLAVTRFSGRRAPLHPGGFPSLPDAVAREAYSHEVSSAGFWPGGSGVEEAMFYSYLYPENDAFSETKIETGHYD